MAIGGNITDTTHATVLYIPKTNISCKKEGRKLSKLYKGCSKLNKKS